MKKAVIYTVIFTLSVFAYADTIVEIDFALPPFDQGGNVITFEDPVGQLLTRVTGFPGALVQSQFGIGIEDGISDFQVDADPLNTISTEFIRVDFFDISSGLPEEIAVNLALIDLERFFNKGATREEGQFTFFVESPAGGIIPIEVPIIADITQTLDTNGDFSFAGGDTPILGFEIRALLPPGEPGLDETVNNLTLRRTVISFEPGVSVPEPSTYAMLLVLGVIGCFMYRKKA